MPKTNHPQRTRLGYLLLGLAVLIFARATSIQAADDKWRASYWNNRDLAGDPVLVRDESSLDHVWNDESPGYPVLADNFSVRWTRSVNFATSGVYRFTATMDDGLRLWVNDAQVINSWNDSQAHTITADVYLAAGDHQLKVEYYEATGGAIAQLSWGLVGGSTANWRGEYFNNKTLFGQPTLVRDDAAINFNWGTGKPADSINGDEFSVRWTRTLPLEAGVYRFTTTTDDGVRLWVNNQLLIDRWQDQTLASFSAEVTLPGGGVPVKMEYYENRDTAVAQLSWVKTAATTGSTTPPTAVAAIPPWTGSYYNNTNLEGSPALVRQDPGINIIWGSSSPLPNVVNADRFSVRWTTTANLPAGSYRFTTFVEGGTRLWVNDQLIIDEWRDYYQVKEWANVINLPGGSTTLRLEFFEDVGLAEARLVVQPQSGGAVPSSPTTTPTSPSGSLTATVINARALNVRSGPGAEFEPFTYVSGGQLVNLTGYRSSGWVQIRLLDGRTGWVGGAYLGGYNYNALAQWSGG
ncbi:MAG: SH3 domain-containing protein [Chloroflexi bacterium]|nr:SH3 domain-containing protein [Chloroflexota bacterium]